MSHTPFASPAWINDRLTRPAPSRWEDRIPRGFRGVLFTEPEVKDGVASFSQIDATYGDLFKTRMQTIIDARNASIRKALIKLGWRPPFRSIYRTDIEEAAHCYAQQISDSRELITEQDVAWAFIAGRQWEPVK